MKIDIIHDTYIPKLIGLVNCYCSGKFINAYVKEGIIIKVGKQTGVPTSLQTRTKFFEHTFKIIVIIIIN